MAQSFKHAIDITVDDREVASGIIPTLQETEGVTVRVRRLEVGDYLIAGKLIVERKTLNDFAASIVDGRLFSQASRLASLPLRHAVILEGTAADLSCTNIHREAIQGAIISLTIIFGIPLLRSRDINESAHLLIYAAEQLRKRSSYNSIRNGKRPKGKRRL